MTAAAAARAPVGARLPGQVMLHPAMVLAVGVLAVNDHWLKGRIGAEPGVGLVTGKLSDVAGLAFFPALLVSVVEVVRWLVHRLDHRLDHRRGDGWVCTRREMAAAAAVTAAGFAAVQVLPAAAAGYEAVLTVLRWCPGAAVAVVAGGPSPPLPQIDHVMDATDILCLPAVWFGYRAGCRVGVPDTRRAGADGR